MTDWVLVQARHSTSSGTTVSVVAIMRFSLDASQPQPGGCNSTYGINGGHDDGRHRIFAVCLNVGDSDVVIGRRRCMVHSPVSPRASSSLAPPNGDSLSGPSSSSSGEVSPYTANLVSARHRLDNESERTRVLSTKTVIQLGTVLVLGGRTVEEVLLEYGKHGHPDDECSQSDSQSDSQTEDDDRLSSTSSEALDEIPAMRSTFLRTPSPRPPSPGSLSSYASNPRVVIYAALSSYCQSPSLEWQTSYVVNPDDSEKCLQLTRTIGDAGMLQAMVVLQFLSPTLM